MAVPRVRGNYDELAQIAKTFGAQADQIDGVAQRLKQNKEVLRNGGWVGKGADAFYAEMDTQVLPAVQRLTQALRTGGQVTAQISAIIQQVETEVAALFRSTGAGSDPGGPTAQSDLEVSLGRTIAGLLSPIAQAPVQSDLEKKIREMLGNGSPADRTPLLDAIHNATLADRQAILNNPALLKMISDSLGPKKGTVYVAALFEGALHWPRGSGPLLPDYYIYVGVADPQHPDPDTFDDFAEWIRGGVKPKLDTNGKMNCWEYTMFSAYKADVVNYDDLKKVHDAAALAGQQGGENAYFSRLGTALGADNAQTVQQPHYDGTSLVSPVPAGSLVYFGDLEHVAISTGRLTPEGEVEIMSLWKYPRDANDQPVHETQRTTIRDILDAMQNEGLGSPTVQYGTPNYQ
jgi:WXG100 family type VII secretion target